MNEFDVSKISIKDISTNVYTEKDYKISIEDFIKLGYIDEQANELMKCAEYTDEMLPIDVDEATMSLIDKFNEIGCTSFRMTADELRELEIK